jgi:general secretion pathway protein H
MDIDLKELSLRLVRNLSAIRKKDSRQAGMTGSENVGPTGHKLSTRQAFGISGFTLLELAAVVFIISMIAALVFPAFFGTDNKIKAEARKTASLLRYLNDNAISTKSTYPLKFNLQEGVLSWQGLDGEKTEKLQSLVSLTLTSKGTIREGEVTVFFGPLGIQENLAVNLRNEDRDMAVSINPVSGRVKITEGGQE